MLESNYDSYIQQIMIEAALAALWRGVVCLQRQTSYTIQHLQHLCSVGILTMGMLLISTLLVFSEDNPVVFASYIGLCCFIPGVVGLPPVDYYHTETPTTTQKVSVWLTLGCVGPQFFPIGFPAKTIMGISLISLVMINIHQLFTGTIRRV